jgi:hypothetical protein
MCHTAYMDADVAAYIQTIDDPVRKQDVAALVDMLSGSTGEAAKMWGTAIIAFGMYHYVYESGREGDAPKIGLSNRKQAIVLYGLHISDESHPNYALLSKLGTHKTGKGCLYITRLTNVDMTILEQMVRSTHR